jgi:hypothetical protein
MSAPTLPGVDRPQTYARGSMQLELELGPFVQITGKDLTIQERFWAFHTANPWVYRALCALTKDLLSRGRKKLGIGMLWEVLRWHYWRATVDASSDFKLNDHYRSRYVRLLLQNHPEWEDVFEIRQLRSP